MRYLILGAALLLAACADSAAPPVADVAQRNVTVGGMGVASLWTTCGDGMQRDTPGVGIGLIITACPFDKPEPKTTKDRPTQLPAGGTGIVAVGVGPLAVAVSNCYGWELTGIGLGMGAFVAPCPGERFRPGPTPKK